MKQWICKDHFCNEFSLYKSAFYNHAIISTPFKLKSCENLENCCATNGQDDVAVSM